MNSYNKSVAIKKGKGNQLVQILCIFANMTKGNNILDGFRLALSGLQPDSKYSPVFEVTSILLGTGIPVLSSEDKRWSTFIAEVEQFASKSYIPVIGFPASLNRTDLFCETIALVEDTIIRQASMENNVAIGLKYMIDECTDNIIEHSKSEYGYISSAIDRGTNTIDICIADKGITVLGSFQAKNDPDIISDLEALQAANRGISTKNRPDAENRGYGLATTKKMIVNGLGGSFAMISGSSVYILDERGGRFLDSSRSVKIAGTIIMMRIPYINKEFKYINYVE